MSNLDVSISTSAIAAFDKHVGNVKSNDVAAKLLKPENQQVAKDKQPTKQQVDVVVKELNEFMESTNRGLSFSVDEQLGIDVVSVMDLETEEVIRQIPSEDLVVLRKKMDDIAGILFETKA